MMPHRRASRHLCPWISRSTARAGLRVTEDDRTPPIRLVTENEREAHYDEWEPGTPIVRKERLMVRDPEPSELLQRIERLEESHKSFQKFLWLVIPTLLGGFVTALVYASDKIAASAERVGKTEATIESLKDKIAGQEQEIGQLRAALLRLSGAEPHKPTSNDVRMTPTPDRVADAHGEASRSGASIPASTSDDGTGSGWMGTNEHTPPLQYLHVVGGCEQNELLAHSAPHVALGPMSRSMLSTDEAGGVGSSGGGAQAANATRIAMRLIRMPGLYPDALEYETPL